LPVFALVTGLVALASLSLCLAGLWLFHIAVPAGLLGVVSASLALGRAGGQPRRRRLGYAALGMNALGVLGGLGAYTLVARAHQRGLSALPDERLRAEFNHLMKKTMEDSRVTATSTDAGARGP
jgi:hypothetical protein